MNSIFENAVDSLEVGMKFFLSSGERTSRKHAILTIFHSIELFLKEYLYRQNPILIYRNIDKKIHDDSLTVGISEILIRLGNMNIALPEEEVKTIRSIQKRRNRIEHHRYDIVEEDENTIAESLKFIIFFTEFYLDEKISDHIDSEVQSKIQNLVMNYMDRWNLANINLNKWLMEQFPGWSEDISDTPDEFPGTLHCPICREGYLIIEDIDKPFCFWCNMVIDAEECENCGQTFIKGDGCCAPEEDNVIDLSDHT